MVRELTGDWFAPVECDKIQAKKRDFNDELVYYGAKADIEKDGPMELLKSVAMADRYSHDEQKVGFWYVEDPECRKTRDLDVNKNYIGLYNGDNSIPTIFEVVKDEVDIQEILMELNVAIVKGTPRWGQRGMSAIFEYQQSALIYMIPEHVDNR